jgi:hypothetical protein
LRQEWWRYHEKVKVVSPPSHKYLHPNNPKFTLKIGKVRVVEMLEIPFVYRVKKALYTSKR